MTTLSKTKRFTSHRVSAETQKSKKVPLAKGIFSFVVPVLLNIDSGSETQRMNVLDTFDPLPASPALFSDMHVADYDQMDTAVRIQPRINGYTQTQINGATQQRINGMTQSRANGATHFNHSK